MLTAVIAAVSFALGIILGMVLRRPSAPAVAVVPSLEPPAVDAAEAPAARPVRVVRAARRREGAVLVCDLRPAEDEALSTAWLRFVADLQRVLGGIVADEGGRVDRFSGERLTAVFAGETSDAAIEAAERMTSNVEALGRRTRGGVAIGIGVHFGPLSDGESESGDTFDIAARLQALTREKGTCLLLSGAAVEHSPGGENRFEPAGEIDAGVARQRLYAPKSALAAVQLELLDVAEYASVR